MRIRCGGTAQGVARSRFPHTGAPLSGAAGDDRGVGYGGFFRGGGPRVCLAVT